MIGFIAELKYPIQNRMSTIIFGVLQASPHMVDATYQMKNGSQQSMNAPIIMPNVLAALCSRFILLIVRFVGVEEPDSGSSPCELRCGGACT
jgi:hypothetical protein